MSLDTFNVNLCVWRCIAVHRRARPDRSTAAARQLAQSVFNILGNEFEKTSLDELTAVERFLNGNKLLREWVGVGVYEPERTAAGETVRHLCRNAPPRIKNVLTISAFDGHAFLMKHINRLAGVYNCGQCGAQLTQAPHLQRHPLRCANGEFGVFCYNEEVPFPASAFENALFSVETLRVAATNWIESEARRRGIYVHHTVCGYGEERWVAGQAVDSFQASSGTVFQSHGCYYHGCLKCYSDRRVRFVEGKTTTQLL